MQPACPPARVVRAVPVGDGRAIGLGGIGEAARVDREREFEIPPEARLERPLLVFDGDCAFCRQWVSRWRGMTGDRVEYRPYQEVVDRLPTIGRERFERAAWLIEPDGRTSRGAAAVFR